MAVFDLKRALVYFVDGYTNTGQVNLMAGYMPGATTMLVDMITGAIPVGVTFTLSGDPDVYTVTAKVDTLGATTSVTFTPGLNLVVTDDEVITFGGRQLQLKIGDGILSFDEKRVMEYKKDRGLLDTVREGDQEPMEVKLDLRWEFLRSDSADPTTDMTPQAEEVLKRTGAASTWVSSASDKCEPYAVNILVVYDPLCPGVKDETILLQDYRWESIAHDMKQGMLNTTGKCNVTQAVVARVAVIPDEVSPGIYTNEHLGTV